MEEVKKKSWFRRHPILSILIVLFIIGGLSYFGVIPKQTSSSGNSAVKETQQTSIPVKPDIWSKTSGYTVDECYEVCDKTYDIQAQVTVCQGNCDMYGKPSASLDKYVNTVKDIKNNSTLQP